MRGSQRGRCALRRALAPLTAAAASPSPSVSGLALPAVTVPWARSKTGRSEPSRSSVESRRMCVSSDSTRPFAAPGRSHCQAAVGGALRRERVTAERPPILLLARDPVDRGHALGGIAHREAGRTSRGCGRDGSEVRELDCRRSSRPSGKGLRLRGAHQRAREARRVGDRHVRQALSTAREDRVGRTDGDVIARVGGWRHRPTHRPCRRSTRRCWSGDRARGRSRARGCDRRPAGRRCRR